MGVGLAFTYGQKMSELRSLREVIYGCMRRRSDALFELTDALIGAGAVPSPVHLSLAPIHRRGWGSLYTALSKGRIDEDAMRDLLAQHPMSRNVQDRTPVYAVDMTSWPRCDAETSPQRSYLYHPSRHSAGQPIVAGWCYQLIAGLSFKRDSWVAPIDARRVEPHEDGNKVAAKQIRQLVNRLPERKDEPLFVFDGGYDPVRLQFDLEEVATQILVRMKPNRTFYFDPVAPEKNPVGHPYYHGRKFDLKDSGTWPEPAHEHRCETESYGSVRVRAWSELHPEGHCHPLRQAGGELPCRGDRGVPHDLARFLIRQTGPSQLDRGGVLEAAVKYHGVASETPRRNH